MDTEKTASSSQAVSLYFSETPWIWMEVATRQLFVIVLFPDSYQLVEREPGNPSLSATNLCQYPYMKRYVALLRGINVGGRNCLPMARLIQILEAFDCLEIKTYIQSGNVVFKHSGNQIGALVDKVRKSIKKEFGFVPNILTLEDKQFGLAVKQNPFQSKTGKDLHFFFLADRPKDFNLEALNSIKAKTERFLIKDNVFYLYAPEGVGQSKLAVGAEKILGVPTTARNFNTILKIQALLDE